MATIVRTIGATARDFATIGAWEIFTDYNLVVSGSIEQGEMYDDNDFNEGTIVIQDAITAPNAYRHLKAAPGEEYGVVTDVGVWIYRDTDHVITVNDESYVRFSSFGISNESAVAGLWNPFRMIVTTSVSGVRFENIYARRINGAGTLFQVQDAENSELINCIGEIYGDDTEFIWAPNTLRHNTVLNCSVYYHGTPILGRGFQFGNGVITNCISINAPTFDFNLGAGVTISYCASADNTATGTGSITGQIGPDLFVDLNNHNFQLKPGSNAIGAGIDLSASGVTTDFVGATRTDPWDMGAYKFTAASDSGGINLFGGSHIVLKSNGTRVGKTMIRI